MPHGPHLRTPQIFPALPHPKQLLTLFYLQVHLPLVQQHQLMGPVRLVLYLAVVACPSRVACENHRVTAVTKTLGLSFDNSNERRRMTTCVTLGSTSARVRKCRTFGTGCIVDAYAIAILGVVNAHHSRASHDITIRH